MNCLRIAKTFRLLAIALPACLSQCATPSRSPEEKHLANIRRLTSGGVHAEAYFSPDGRRLVFQAVRENDRADQIYTMDLESGDIRRISNGRGKTTCSWILPDGRFLYASTHHSAAEPPPRPDRSRGYVWPLYRTFDIFLHDPRDGSLRQLTHSDGYDAECSASPDGERLVFTSQRGGDLAIYTMDLKTGALHRVTRRFGYVGGPFFSPDASRIVYRAYYPETAEETDRLRQMLAAREVRPAGMRLELYVCNADGSDERRITNLGKISFAPYFHPDGRRIIFSSNARAQRPGSYQLFLVREDGGGLEQITFHAGVDLFPCFSPDGRNMVWISDRNATAPGELNIFVADWID